MKTTHLLSGDDVSVSQCSPCSCQTPAVASESSSEPEAIGAPVATELPPPTTSLQHHTAPCLPPYTAYDLQVDELPQSCLMSEKELGYRS